jgi:hypothetical protein
VLVEVQHWSDGDGGAGLTAPGADLVDADEAAGVLHSRQVRTGAVGDRGVADVHVEHDLATRQRQRWVAPTSKLAEGVRSADVEGVGAAQLRQLGRPIRQGGVEVEGVGEVELALDVDGAVEVDHVGVDGDVPVLGCCDPSLVRVVGVEPDQGLFHEPVELGDADLVREAGDVPVDVLGTLDREADGVLGDAPGSPRRKVPGLDPRPDPGEPVGELEGLGDQGAAGVGGDVECDGQLVSAELADLGVPSPAIKTALSNPIGQDGSGSCIAAQSRSSSRIRTSARSAVARSAWTAASTAAGESA